MNIAILPLLLLGGLLMLGIVVTAVVLLVYPKTRVVGIVLCSVIVMLLASSIFLRTKVGPPEMPPDVRNPSGQPGAAVLQDDVGIGSETSEAPDWIDAPPRLIGDAYRMSIAVGPYTTRAECDAQLPSALQKALDRYVEVCLGEEVRRRIVLPADYLRQLVKDRWEEVRQHSFGPMTTQHVLLEFDRKAKDRVLDELRRTKVAGRLWFAGVGWVVWLALLGGVYGYLRIAGSRKSG